MLRHESRRLRASLECDAVSGFISP
jgi:hypothetical protein